MADLLATGVNRDADVESAEQAIELRRHAELAPVEPVDVPVTVSVGPGGEAVAVWSDRRGRDTLQGRTTLPGEGSFPDPTTDAGVTVHVATYTPQLAAVVHIENLRLAHCHVQPLPGGQILLVASRCRWRRDGVDRNALNVAGETAWSTYYSDFPIVCIAADTVRSWPGSRAAAYALITDSTRCALVGGYGQHRDWLLVGDLDRSHFEPYRLTLPGGRPLPADIQVIGRGPELHVFAGTTWYRLGVDDIR